MARQHPRYWGWLLPLQLSLILYSFATQAVAELQAFADPRTLDEMESFQLRLRLEGAQEAPDIDTSALSQDFEIINSNKTSQYRSINGRTQSWVEVQLTLRPKRAGTLTVPPLTLGGETSRALEIQVNPLDANIKQAIADMVFFETELSPNPAFVQSESVLTRRLYYSTSGGVQMYSEMPGAPDMADAVVVPLGQTRSYTDQRDGINYGVVEQRFAIVPEQSGSLDIPQVAITSSIRLMKNGRVRRSGIRVSSEALTLQVLPIPPEYPANQPWLAATNLELIEIWQPNPPTFVVGEPVTRQVVARITGNVASAIPPLTTEVQDDVFRAYPEPPQLQDNNADASNQGTRAETFSLLPSKGGNADIPSVAVTWWNVISRKVEVARLPARSVLVSPGVGQPNITPEPADTPAVATTPAATATNNATNPANATNAEEGSDIANPPRPRFSSLQLSLFALVLFVVGLAGYQKWGNRLVAVAKQFLAQLGPGTTTPGGQGASAESGNPIPNLGSHSINTVPKANPKRAFGLLKKTLQQAPAAHRSTSAELATYLKQTLIVFARQHQGLTPRQALQALQQHAATADLLHDLNRCVFDASDATAPSLEHVSEAAQSFDQAQHRRTRVPPLPTLYPTTNR